MKNICVVGVGYVGIITAACFADLGNKVVAIDFDQEKIAGLKKGKMPIYEPGLKELIVQFNQDVKRREFPGGKLNAMRVDAVEDAIKAIEAAKDHPKLRSIQEK